MLFYHERGDSLLYLYPTLLRFQNSHNTMMQIVRNCNLKILNVLQISVQNVSQFRFKKIFSVVQCC